MPYPGRTPFPRWRRSHPLRVPLCRGSSYRWPASSARVPRGGRARRDTRRRAGVDRPGPGTRGKPDHVRQDGERHHRALCAGASADEVPLLPLFTGRIRAWQAFMEAGRADVLSPAAEVGLVGELRFLQQILDAGVEPSIAVDGWCGPIDGLHDFLLGTGAVEVKTTTTSGEFPATIASLEQLDDSLVPTALSRRCAPRSAGVRPHAAGDPGRRRRLHGRRSACTSPIFPISFSGPVFSTASKTDTYGDSPTVRSMLFRVTDTFPRLTRQKRRTGRTAGTLRHRSRPRSSSGNRPRQRFSEHFR